MKKNLPVVIVTGSARNIGKAIAIEFAKHEYHLVINGRTHSTEIEKTITEVKALGVDVIACCTDVSTPEGAQKLIADTAHHFGRIDVLVNNAALRRHSELEGLTWQEWREVMGAILDSAFLCSQAAAPFLKNSDCASIVMMGGLSAHTGSKERAHVVSAKMGLVGLTKALANDLSEFGITVNCVVPGLIDTVRGESAGQGNPEHHHKNRTLVGRRGLPEEVAHLVYFLCSEKGRYINGQAIHANGGAYLAN